MIGTKDVLLSRVSEAFFTWQGWSVVPKEDDMFIFQNKLQVSLIMNADNLSFKQQLHLSTKKSYGKKFIWRHVCHLSGILNVNTRERSCSLVDSADLVQAATFHSVY